MLPWTLPTLHQIIRSDVFDWNISPVLPVISTAAFIVISGYYWNQQQRRVQILPGSRICNVPNWKSLKKRRRTLLITPLTISEVPPEDRKRNIIILGLAGAGKTAFLQRLLHSKDGNSSRVYDDPEPTLGVKMTSVERHGLRNNYYEVGGADNTRAFVKEFLHLANLVVFVVDAASDDEELQSAKQYYQLISQKSDYFGPIVVIASKQDYQNARSVREIYDRLEVSDSDDVHILPAISAPRSFGDATERDQLTGIEDDSRIAPKTTDTRNIQTLMENLLYRTFV